MKIELNPKALVIPKHGAIDVICKGCGQRTLNEFPAFAGKMKCSYCGTQWRVNGKGCPTVESSN